MGESSDVIAQIQATSNQLRRAASEVSARIKAFEAWINTLPGRVECCVSMGGVDDSLTEQRMDLVRDGKEWVLRVYDYNLQDETAGPITLLRDASAMTKATAVSYFPMLLNELSLQQATHLAVMEQAVRQFDEFSQNLPGFRKEGK